MYAKQCESCYVEMKWENPFVKIIQFYLLSWNSSEIFPNRSYRASQISHNIYSAFQIPGLSEHSIKPKPILMMLDDLMANGERHRQTVAEWIFDFYINLLSSQMSVVVVGPENGMIIFFPNWDFYWSKDFDTSLWLKRFSCLMEAIREAWRKGLCGSFSGLVVTWIFINWSVAIGHWHCRLMIYLRSFRIVCNEAKGWDNAHSTTCSQQVIFPQ